MVCVGHTRWIGLLTKLPIFNSKFLCPKTSLVDAFSVSWEGHNNWLVPPVELVGHGRRPHFGLCYFLS